MSLGTKLQAVHSKVNKKLGRQGGPIIFRKVTTTETTIGRPVVEVNTDIQIDDGCRVSTLTVYQIGSSGKRKVGDLRMIVPANKITRDQIKGAFIVYNSERYTIVDFNSANVEGTPPILSDVVVNWEVIARLEG